MNPVLARLLEERAKHIEYIDTLRRVDEDQRDLVDAETRSLQSTRDRIAQIDAQIEPLEQFEQARAAHQETATATDSDGTIASYAWDGGGLTLTGTGATRTIIPPPAMVEQQYHHHLHGHRRRRGHRHRQHGRHRPPSGPTGSSGHPTGPSAPSCCNPTRSFRVAPRRPSRSAGRFLTSGRNGAARSASSTAS